MRNNSARQWTTRAVSTHFTLDGLGRCPQTTFLFLPSATQQFPQTPVWIFPCSHACIVQHNSTDGVKFQLGPGIRLYAFPPSVVNSLQGLLSPRYVSFSAFSKSWYFTYSQAGWCCCWIFIITILFRIIIEGIILWKFAWLNKYLFSQLGCVLHWTWTSKNRTTEKNDFVPSSASSVHYRNNTDHILLCQTWTRMRRIHQDY